MSAVDIRLKRYADLDAAELAAWRTLVDTYPHLRNAFLSASFVASTAETNPTVRVVVWSDGGRPIAFLPIQKRAGFSGLFGMYEPVGGSMNDCFGLIAAPDFRCAPQGWLQSVGVAGLAFTHLEQSQLTYGLTGECSRIGLRTRLQEPAGEFWERLRTQDKKLVADTERRQRKLVAKHGTLEFELRSSDAHADLDTLIALKQDQYRRTGKRRAALFDQANIRMLHDLLDSRDAACCGMLSVLRVPDDGGSRIVAAHFGLRCHDTLHFWFPVYDQDFHVYAPGRILLKHVIEAGAECGIRCIDRGEGDTQAKRDFSNEEHLFYRGVWMRPSAWAARLALSLSWRIEDMQERIPQLARSMRARLMRQLRNICYGSGLLSLLHRWRNKHTLTIFMFHRVLPKDSAAYASADREFTFSTEGFERTLSFIRKHYQVVDIQRVQQCASGKAELPSRAGLIAFDDGWCDTLEHALPLLKSFQLPGVMFVTEGQLNSTENRWWQDALVALMANAAHTAALLDQLGIEAGAERLPWRLATALAELAPEHRRELLARYVDLSAPQAQMVSIADLQALEGTAWTMGAHDSSPMSVAPSVPQEETSLSATGGRAVCASAVIIPEDEWTYEDGYIAAARLATYLFFRPRDVCP